MRKLLLIGILALLVPTAALGAVVTTHPVAHTKSMITHPIKPKPPIVTFVLHGTLSNYTSAGVRHDGAVTITVTSSNFEAKALDGLTLPFLTTAKTNVVLHADGPILNGDRGVVKVRARLRSPVVVLQTHAVFELIDQGAM